jgi:catechol 2,3-dioxygenase-like lactoylglutathione lyase family enzyme
MLTGFKVYAVLPSSDLERARTWYEQKTGTTPTMSDLGGLWYECAEGTWFIVTPSAYAGTAQNTAASFQVTGIEQVMADMRERGVAFEEYDLPDFKTEDGLFSQGHYKAAWFKDADGNIIEISEVLDEG